MAEKKNAASTDARLYFAYFLQLAVWGSWTISLGALANERGFDVGLFYSAFTFGALFAPLFGPLADRKFAAQKVAAFLHFVGAVALTACGAVANAETLNRPLLAALMFLAGLAYMPTIPLTNAVVFKHYSKPERVSLVFMFGTLGWMVVNFLVRPTTCFYVGGALSLFFAFYSATLPNTPPTGAKNNDPFGLKALALFKRRDFALFMICAFMTSIFGSNFYNPMLGAYVADALGVPTEYASTFATLNQVSELIFTAALSFAVLRVGLKGALTLGLVAWGLRYALFATCVWPAAIAGMLLHGVAFAFLYTAAYMFGDRVATAETKASTQALIAFLLLGVSQIISGFALDGLKARNVLAVAPEAAVVQTERSAGIAQISPTPESAEIAQSAETAQNGEIVETSAVVASVESARSVESAQINNAPAAETDWSRALRFPAIFCFVWGVVFFAFGREPKAPEFDDATQERPAA
ncbi:MAG: MFS transporter [Thermoguttaceae bacterium]|nr:MFS transporter [Thermoguttaceae bacterium]